MDRFATETTGYFKPIPFTGDAGINPQAIHFRADAQNILGGAVVCPGSRTGQPGGPGVPRPRREGRISRLPLDIRLGLPDLSPVIIGSWHGSSEIFVSPVAIPRMHSAITPQPWVWLNIPAFSLIPGLKTTDRITSTGVLTKGGAHSISRRALLAGLSPSGDSASVCSGVAAPLITDQIWVFR